MCVSLCLGGDVVHALAALHVLRELMAQINAERKTARLPPSQPWQVFDLIGGSGAGGSVD